MTGVDPDVGARLSVAGLQGVPETLLIPLAGRALAREQHPDLGFADPWAEAVVAKLAFDPRRFAPDVLAMRACAVRARLLDDLARDFLRRHPGALGVSLGAGLDARFQRVDDGRGTWVDIDLPEVVALKRQLLPETERYRMIACSITDPAWIAAAGWAPERPAFLVSEGVLIYLPRAAVDGLLRAIAAHARGPAEIACDYTIPLLALLSGWQPSIGQTSARLAWGVFQPQALAATDPRLALLGHVGILEPIGGFVGLGARAYAAVTGGHLYGIAHLGVREIA